LKPSLKIAVLLLVVTLLMILSIGMSFWSFSRIEDAAAARKHITTILGSANQLLSELKDAETGQRGFLLTDDPHFLEPYLAVRKNLIGEWRLLREQTAISAARRHLDGMEPVIDAKLAELSQSIEMRRGADLAGAIALVKSGAGKALMDTLRLEMATFIAIEEAARSQHDSDFQTRLSTLFRVIVATSLLTLLFVVALVTLIYRESRNQLKSRIHAETGHLLAIQETVSEELRQTNTRRRT
jgi:CHASE3 domain sensor protein